MSGSAIIIAGRTTLVEDAPAQAAAATDWLLDQRIVQPHDRPDSLWRPSRYVPLNELVQEQVIHARRYGPGLGRCHSLLS
ncbi:hypothetical protein ACFUJ0_26145 [Streptomyces sp. NPDC057242]|uniref:hypothetical protein n=1 Tax=unclassified Streptomyces TaxID=2593676 RepID=UPI00362F60FB